MILSRRRGWIGIDLGVRDLKLAQVERTGRGLRIATSAVVERGGGRNPQDDDPRNLTWSGRDVLGALSLDASFTGRRVACALPMHLTDLHALPLPPGEPGERRAMAAHELPSLFPGDPEPREFDLWETDLPQAEESAATKNVNVLSVPRNLVSSVVESLSEAKLSCQVMDGLPFALARAVKLASRAGSTAPTGVVDWGFASGTFCVASDGRPVFTRHLRNCGFAPVVDAVSRALDVSHEETRRLLAEAGLPIADDRSVRRREIQNVIAEVAAQFLNELIDELKKTISYLKMQYPQFLFSRLRLLGDGAVVTNLPAFLSDRVGVPVDVWRLPRAQGDADDASGHHPAVLATAAALSALAWES
ncbi:MAG: pilus assembly protein PilM [Planctomycetota bacterium]|jgi:Tfp pilus assembly PilM family ATPase